MSAFAPPADYTNLAPGTLNASPATFANGNPGNLGGDIDTLLSNNVVTTKIDPTLTAKSSFRYYDFDNQTPSYNFTSMPNGFVPTNTLTMGYDKINAGEELNWRPDKYWNLGARLQLRALRLDGRRCRCHEPEWRQSLCRLQALYVAHLAGQRRVQRSAL